MTVHERAPRRGSMLKNFAHLGLGQVATMALTILLSATVARTLSPADFGLMVLLNSIAGFVYVVVDWGHAPIVIRESARQPHKSGSLFGSAMAVRTVVALLACPAALVATWLLDYDLRTRVLACFVILSLLPQYLGLSFGWVFRAQERMDRDAQLTVAQKVINLILALTCLALGGRLLGLVFSGLLAGCLTLLIAILMYRKLQLPRLSASMPTARMLLYGGAPIFAMSAATAFENVMNTNILYKLASPMVVGWFGAAWTIAGTLLAPGTILGAVMYPRLSTASNDPAEFKRTFDVSFRPLLLLAVLGAVGTYLFADVPVTLIYGVQKFGAAADTLRAFAPVLLFVYIDLFLSMAIIATGKTGWIAAAKATSVVLTTGLVFVLVPLFQERFGNGGLGVMYALAVGEALMFAACLILLRRTVDRHTLGSMIRSLIAGAASVIVIQWLPAITPFVTIPLCVLVFAGTAVLVGAVDQSDVKLLVLALRSRGK